MAVIERELQKVPHRAVFPNENGKSLSDEPVSHLTTRSRRRKMAVIESAAKIILSQERR